MDGDNKPDIVIADNGAAYSEPSISVFRNTSTNNSISFTTKTDFFGGKSPSTVTIADFDGDGKNDLAMSTDAGGSLLRNISTIGTINFSPRIELPIKGSVSLSLATGDLDGDGKLDIAIPEFDDIDSVVVYKNLSSIGNFKFGNPVRYETGPNPYGIATADFTQDGKLDIAVVNNSQNFEVPCSVSLLKSQIGKVLAYNLLSLKAIVINNQVQLNWEIPLEETSVKFIIERSKDALDFSEIGAIPVSETSLNSFSYRDENPIKGINYYRLKVIDKDGSYFYSNIIKIVISVKEILIRPNPASGFTILNHPSSSSTSKIKLVDNLGRVIKVIDVVPNTIETIINLKGVSSGIYKIIWLDKSINQIKTLIVK